MLPKGLNLSRVKDSNFQGKAGLSEKGLIQAFPSIAQEKDFDPRVKRTRQLIIQAFMDLLKEKDFQSLTVQDIAERATVNRATFYAHFEDKYALMDYLIRHNLEQLLYNRLSLQCALNEDNLRRFIMTAFEFLEEFHGQCNKHYSSKKFEPLIEGQVQVLLNEFLLGWFQRTLSEEVRGQLDLEVLTSTISWAIFGAGLEWSKSTKKSSIQKTVDQVLDLLTKGLLQRVLQK